MWNPFKRSEKPIEQVVEKDANYFKTIFEYNQMAEYSLEEKMVMYRECATIKSMDAFDVLARGLIQKYGFNIIRDLDNTPIKTTRAELERQKILAIEDFVEQVEIAASRLKETEDEKPQPIGVQEYFNNNQ